MAQYRRIINVIYSANGGRNAPSTNTITRITDNAPFSGPFNIVITNQTPKRDGYSFLGWSASSSASSAAWHGGDTVHLIVPYSSDYDKTYNFTFYAVWEPKEYVIFYRPGTYGTGSADSDRKVHDVDLTLKGALFTRSGYRQSGWSLSAAGSSYAYGLGGKYTANAGATLYPYWRILISTISSVTDSVPADGSTEGTIVINRPVSSYTHKVVISIGSRSAEYTNVGTSLNFTIPAAWVDQIPNATASVATVTLITYKNGSQIGTNEKTFTITVPDSIVPTISLTGANVSDNSTVSGWDVLVQGYSKIALTAVAAAGSGATISSIVFSGDGVSQTGTGTTVTSDILQNSGSRTWTAVVTDSRGRTATTTLTRTVNEYYPTAILAFSAFRSTSEGNPSPSGGEYITAAGNYSFASCAGHNSASVKKIEYKRHTEITWTTGENSAASGTRYTFGTISLLYVYDVKMTVTDALGSTASYIVNISSVDGVSFGLNGKCARFGGPVQYDDRFECDWDTQFNGQIEAPLFLQTGSIAASVVEPGTTKTIDVTFNREFITNPFVAVSLLSPQTVGMDLCNVSVWNIGKTGFSARLTNGYETNRSLGVCWIAMARKDINVAIREQPNSVVASAGSSVNFSVVAVNATKYQWYYLDPFEGVWSIVAGDVGTYASYIFVAAAGKDGFQYKCNVSNNIGNVDSDIVELTISGAVRIIDKIPYIKRLSGGGLQIGNREIDKLIGGTVVWNQLAKKINSTNWRAESGVTATFGDGEVTFSYPATSNKGVATRTSESFVKDHKYVVLADVKSPTVISASKVLIGGSSTSRVRIEASITTTDTWIAKGTIANCVASTSSPIYAFVSGQAYTDLIVRNVMVIDITQMFGSTIADYIYSLEQANAGAGVAWFRNLFTNDYYAYDVGTLLSVKTSAHVMKDANDNVIGNYPLDSNLELRGVLKLDANNNLYYDGDSYESDGTVIRRYGTRSYQSGDETDGSTMVTDGTTTVYALSDPTTETADAFQNPQTVDPDGSEEYTDSRTVPMPVGHETWYKSAT